MGLRPQIIACIFLGISFVFLLSCVVLQRFIDVLESDYRQGAASIMRHSFEPGHGHRAHGPLSRDRRSKHDIGMTSGSDESYPRPNSLRSEYESSLDPSIIVPALTAMREDRIPPAVDSINQNLTPYDIRRCPEAIPVGYPMQWSVLDVLQNWNPDNTTLPKRIYQGVCELDWNDPVQRDIALEYRKAEVPFLLHHHPEIAKTAERWSHYDYLEKLLGGDSELYRNEHSPNNHMPFWKLRGGHMPHNWKPPTENVELSFPEWYRKAVSLEDEATTTESDHFYFRLNGEFESNNGFLYDELPIFAPDRRRFFMVDPRQQRGINCRFGSKGTIAETHYDLSRNFILMLKGKKRYILAHPHQCQNLELHPQGHPSARHSKIDWSKPNEWQSGRFSQAQVNEVILQAGDALYLPTAWFHFIVSLNLNYQCNARSGITHENKETLTACGFPS